MQNEQSTAVVPYDFANATSHLTNEQKILRAAEASLAVLERIEQLLIGQQNTSDEGKVIADVKPDRAEQIAKLAQKTMGRRK